jgi:hypothetical protein
MSPWSNFSFFLINLPLTEQSFIKMIWLPSDLCELKCLFGASLVDLVMKIVFLNRYLIALSQG